MNVQREQAIADLIGCAETAVEMVNNPELGAEEICLYVSVALAAAVRNVKELGAVKC